MSARAVSMIWLIATWALEGVAFASLLAAGAADIVGRIVPNRLVLVIMAAGAALRFMSGLAEVWPSFAIWAASIGLLGILAAREVLGWGDVKLIAAVTLLVPPRGVAPMLIATALAGGVLAGLYLAAQWALRFRPLAPLPLHGPTQRTMSELLRRESVRIQANEPMPYAIAVLCGVSYQIAIEIVRCHHAMSCLY